MIVRDTGVKGAYVIEPEVFADQRGFFARLYNARELAERGLDMAVAECSVAFNRSRGTLRGLHYQTAPREQAKLVRCTRGSVYDVAVDLRPGSPTHLRWTHVELDAENRFVLYVPAGCAHGYLTLDDETELLYWISRPYAPEAEAGIRGNDPRFGIRWPAEPSVMSPRDASFPDFTG